MIKKKFQELMQQPMTRREFLRNVGLLCLGFIGVHNALNILSSGHTTTIVQQQILNPRRGFGGGKFGV